MATANILLQNACAGGNHITLQLTIGANTFNYQFLADDLIVALSDEDRQRATLAMAKFHCRGMTRAEARTALMSGITVTTTSP